MADSDSAPAVAPAESSSRLIWGSVVATLAASLIVTVGGLVTTASSLPEPPTAFLLTPTGHQRVAEIAGTVTMLYLLWAGITGPNVAVKKTAWATLGALLGAGALGFLRGIGPGVSPSIGTLHATLAHLVVTGVVVVGLLSSAVANRPIEPMEDYGWPSLRSIGKLVPILVFTQVVLGAAFRQGAIGLMPHIVGAMAVSLFVLMVGAFALQQFPNHKPLAPTARILLGLLFTQAFFGLASFTVRSLTELPPDVLLIVTGVHVLVGAWLLAASTAMGILTLRYVAPKGTSSTRTETP